MKDVAEPVKAYTVDVAHLEVSGFEQLEMLTSRDEIHAREA